MKPESDSNNLNKMFNPFPGLRPFKVEESHLFFGREGQSEEILKKLSDEKFVAVIGASGSGKSSLIYCGLVPTLYGGFIGDTKSKWNIIAARPGNAPIENLAAAILEKSAAEENEGDNLIKQKFNASILRSSSNGLVELLDQSFDFKSDNILVIIDQFEELFRYKTSGKGHSTYNESEAFVKLLVNANKTTDIPVYVVLTMRSDFIGECSQFHELTELINDSNYLVPQMTRDDFKNAVEGPVAVGGATIDTQLVQQLLNEVGDNPDQLPILQHALMRTWEYWMDHSDKEQAISISDYEAIGKMEKALSEHANEAYDELGENEKWICESMFKTITEKGNDNRGIRHPTSINDIASISKSSVEEVIRVINPFRAAGRSFITPSHEKELKGDSIIDLSHESLMRIWNKLKVWVEEEWEAVQMYLRLSDASEMYQIGSTGLWRPPDLQLALNWKEKQKPTLAWAQRYNPAFERAVVYLDTSDKEFKAEEENKIKLQKRQLRRSKIFAIVLGSAAILGMGLTVYSQMMRTEAVKQQQEALRQTEIAKEKEQEANIQKENALKQEQIANEQKDNAQLQEQIALQKEKEAKASADVAERQRKIATQREEEATKAKKEADISAAEALKQSEIAKAERQEAFRLRMLSIGQSMAVKSQQISDNTQLKALVAYQAYLFNEKYNGPKHNPDVYLGLYYALKGLKGQSYNALNGHAGAVQDVEFIPESSFFYSAGGDGKILKWDVENLGTPYEILRESSFEQKALGITYDKKWLICSAEENQIELINLDNNVELNKKLLGHTRTISGIAVAPNNEYFITSSNDKTIRKWNLKTFEGEIFIESESKINTIDISPDSKSIIVGTQDGKISIWNANGGSEPKIVEDPDKAAITAVRYDNNGKWIVTGDSKGNVKIRNAQTFAITDNLEGHKSRVSAISFNKENNLMATSSWDGTVRIWDFTNLNNQPIILTDHSNWVMSLSFSPNGEKLVSTSNAENRILTWPTKSEYLATDVRDRITRNMTTDEWNAYVAEDVDYEKTITELNN